MTLPQASGDAVNLIVSEEDGSQLQYVRHYQHFEWPGGFSGPTVGIGYDCGQTSAAQIRADWSGIVDGATVAVLVRAAGLKGGAGHEFVLQHGGSVTIGWDQAIRQFSERELPKTMALCAERLPNFIELNGDCAGALASVTYNRGASFDLPGERYAEMRAIKAHMAARNFSKIPADLLAMQRLWPKDSDLWRRRAHEAALFRKGLQSGAETAPPVAASALPSAPPALPPGAPAAAAPLLPSLAETWARLRAFSLF